MYWLIYLLYLKESDKLNCGHIIWFRYRQNCQKKFVQNRLIIELKQCHDVCFFQRHFWWPQSLKCLKQVSTYLSYFEFFVRFQFLKTFFASNINRAISTQPQNRIMNTWIIIKDTLKYQHIQVMQSTISMRKTKHTA